MTDSANRRPAGPPGSAARRQTRVLVIVGLAAVAVAASALVGWRFARESTPVTGPILLISIDPLPRRPAAGLRRRRGRDPAPRSTGRRRHRVHPRLRPRRRQPAGARVAVHRPAAVRPRRPRRCRLHARARHRNAGLAAGRPRLRDRRGRVVLPAARRHRARRRLRALRRRAPGGRRRGVPAGRARQRGDRNGGGGLARRAGLGALLLHAAPERHGRRRWHRAGYPTVRGRRHRRRRRRRRPGARDAAAQGLVRRRAGRRHLDLWRAARRATGRGARSRSTRARCTCRCS